MTEGRAFDPRCPRQTFGRREAERAAELKIECISGRGVPAPLTAAALDQALHSSGLLVAGASAMFAQWAKGFQAHTNELPLFDQQRSNKAGGDPNIRYFHSYWALTADQALRIRFQPPRCRCWNFQLNNHWMESLDYRYHPVHTNNELARADDGSAETFTIVVAHADPNAAGRFVGNWVSTVGHECGTMCFRWVAPRLADGAPLPHPRIELVPASQL